MTENRLHKSRDRIYAYYYVILLEGTDIIFYFTSTLDNNIIDSVNLFFS